MAAVCLIPSQPPIFTLFVVCMGETITYHMGLCPTSGSTASHHQA